MGIWYGQAPERRPGPAVSLATLGQVDGCDALNLAAPKDETTYCNPAGIGEMADEATSPMPAGHVAIALESLESHPDLGWNGTLPQRHRFHSRTDPRLMGIPIV